MLNKIYVGVDGGATKSTITVTNEAGKVLGRAVGGSANIRISVPRTWEAILKSLTKIFQECDLSLQNVALHGVMGLAGIEIQAAHQQFLATPHPFKSLQLTSDAHIACLGAHAGCDGSIIIIGTGVVGYQICQNKTSKVGGWGFPHDDIGGGAWLGLEAVKLTLQSLDGRGKISLLTESIYKHFHDDINDLVLWANTANSTQFATLAPLVIDAAANNDEAAVNLMQRSADAITKVYYALGNTQLPCALIGGVAPFINKFLAQEIQNKLVECKMTPDAGAILMARNNKVVYA